MPRPSDADRSSRSRPRYFELPFAVAGQPLVRPDLGLSSMVSRGPGRSYAMDVTILDAADLRLTRAGVTLAHRVSDGRGEWYLSAPGWAPHLPVDRVEPMSEPDLPTELAALVLPLRRNAPLTPVAALHVERGEFLLRGPERETRAAVHDDRVTVRRGGVTVSRYREITVQPVDLTRKQLGWITETLQSVGGTEVTELPPPGARLGVPASGLTSFGAERSWDAETDLETFVAALLQDRLREWVGADLAVRAGGRPDGRLTRVLVGLRAEVRGLSALLATRWVAEVDEELDWLLGALGGVDPDARGDHRDGAQVLSSPRYLHLLDLVAQAAQVPRLGGGGSAAATATLVRTAQQALTELVEAGDALGPDSPTADWERLGVLAQRTHAAAVVARRNLPAWARKLDKRVRRLTDALAGCVDPQLDVIEASVPDLTPVAAFEAGRRHEQLLGAQNRARRELLAGWGTARAKLRAAGRAPR